MSRGRTKIFARVSPTLLAAVAEAAHRRGVDHSTVVREALAAYLEPRRDPAATDLLHSLDVAARAQLTEGMNRFQCTAIDLMRIILRQWAQAMQDPKVWRGWRP